VSDTSFDPKKAWEAVSPELKQLGKETLLKAVDLGLKYFEGSPISYPANTVTGSSLESALARAEALDAKLVNELQKRKEASDLARSVFEAGLKIAVEGAIAGIV
jgi:hypothetical protein